MFQIIIKDMPKNGRVAAYYLEVLIATNLEKEYYIENM